MTVRAVGKDADTSKGEEPTVRRRGGGDTPPSRPKRDPASSSKGRRDTLAGVEDKLTEILSGAALAQSAIGEMSGDVRHISGGEVTAQFAPRLAASWVKLGRSNAAVGKVLTSIVEGSEIGGALAVTAMFVATQAQIYGALPPFPNPYLPPEPVPPSADVRAHEQAVQGRETPPPRHAADNADAIAQAEADRAKAAEARTRGQKGSNVE